MQLEAVIFDMDGVLADTEPLHAKCYCEIFNSMGLHLTPEEYQKHITMGHMDVRDVYVMIGGNMEMWPEVMEKKAALSKVIMKEHCSLRPGVLFLLNELKSEGIPTAIATSAGRRTLGLIMELFDLESYFNEFVTWQDVQATKPSPEAFLLAAEKLGVKPENCVVIEDSPRGVLAAHRAGMKCIAAPTPSTANADFSLASIKVDSIEQITLSTLRSLFI